jgi:hypothetical protein
MGMDETSFFLELEAKVWDALVAGNIKADEELLADDFLGVYSSGMAGKEAHAAQLVEGPTVAKYSLSNARILGLAKDIVLLSYFARWTRVANGKQEAMYITSIWKKIGEKWLNIFSQDTKAEG